VPESAVTPQRVRSVRRKTILADAALVALVALLTGVAVFAAVRLYTTAENRYIDEAFPIRFYARDTLIQMLNQETGVRGYVITRDADSLTPYEHARTAVDQDLTALDRLAKRRPEIAGDIAAARRSVDQLEEYYARQILLTSRGPEGQIEAQGNVLAGKALFDRFRATAASLAGRATRIVADAHDSQRRTYVTTIVIVLAAGITAAAIALWLLLSVPRRIWSLYDNERELRETAERGDRASRSLRHVDDAVVLLDPEGTIRYWNPAATTYLGVSEAGALGKPVAEIVPEFPVIDEAMRADRGPTVAHLTRRGVDRWLVVRGSRFPEGRVLVLQDVTGERQLERARSDFLATASHELRTPLAAVYGAVRTLRRSDRPPDSQLDDTLLNMIESESERLKEIVEQLLVSAEVDRGEIRLQTETCDLRELCESAIAAARAHAPDDFAFLLDAPDDVVVECDRAKLRQVVVNLLDNAVKYSENGNRVEVAVRARPGVASIEVVDQGIGVPEDAHERIFEKFYRLDPAMQRGVGGSGLGLYISRELVERMHGRLRLASRPGSGSTFTVELPL
jgi:PAS domain S-box-containing protein